MIDCNSQRISASTRSRTLRRRPGCAHQRGVVANGLLHHRPQDFFLAFEVMKNAPGLNAHGTGQIAHRGAFVAFVAKQVSRHLQELAAGTVRIGQLAVFDQFA
jgi:hypothetical protein